MRKRCKDGNHVEFRGFVGKRFFCRIFIALRILCIYLQELNPQNIIDMKINSSFLLLAGALFFSTGLFSQTTPAAKMTPVERIFNDDISSLVYFSSNLSMVLFAFKSSRLPVL